MRGATRRITSWAGGVLGALFALAVVIHVPPMRGWLARHGHHGGGVCPFGYGQQQPRVARTSPDVADRPALAFELGKTNRDDIAAWADGHGVTCHDKHHDTLVECLDVPAPALGDSNALPASGLWLALGADGTLRSIQVTRRTVTATTIADAFTATGGGLAATLGAPSERSGDADARTLASGALRQASVEFRAPGYRARLRETNMGDGYLLTESYARVD
jgi:hypothetical protein